MEKVKNVEKSKNDAVFQDTDKTFAQTLLEAANSLHGEKITVRDLFEMVGEQGLLLFCMILVIPFLLPVSIPGVSTVFGIIIILIGVGVTLNRIPWLPNRLMERPIEVPALKNAMEKGAGTFARLDRVIRPRMLFMSHGATVNRLNGLVLIFAGVLLIFPLGLIPFSNTFPGIAILLLAAGMLQRDGIIILGGYVMTVVTVIYFGFLALAAVAAGQGISSLLGS